MLIDNISNNIAMTRFLDLDAFGEKKNVNMKQASLQLYSDHLSPSCKWAYLSPVTILTHLPNATVSGSPTALLCPQDPISPF